MAIGYGIDLLSSTSFAYGTDYSGYFVTPLYQVGTAQLPYKFTSLEFQLVKPLRTGEGIQISYRDDLTASFTVIRTVIYADSDVGAITAKNIVTELPNDIKACEMIQFKIALLGTATTTPELKSLTIK